LEGLALDFNQYILVVVTKYSWVLNPFGIDIKDLVDGISNIAGLHEQLIEIQNYETLCNRFQEQRSTECILDQSQKGETNFWE
jgi:hypothetical protein